MTPFLQKIFGRQFRDDSDGRGGDTGSATGNNGGLGFGGSGGGLGGALGGFNAAKDSQAANAALGLGVNSSFNGSVSINGITHGGGAATGTNLMDKREALRANFNPAKDSQAANEALGLGPVGTYNSGVTYANTGATISAAQLNAPASSLSFKDIINFTKNIATAVLGGVPGMVTGAIGIADQVNNLPAGTIGSLSGFSGSATPGIGGGNSGGTSGRGGSSGGSSGGGGVGSDIAGGKLPPGAAGGVIPAGPNANANPSTTTGEEVMTAKPATVSNQQNVGAGSASTVTTQTVSAFQDYIWPVLGLAAVIYFGRKHG